MDIHLISESRYQNLLAIIAHQNHTTPERVEAGLVVEVAPQLDASRGRPGCRPPVRLGPLRLSAPEPATAPVRPVRAAAHRPGVYLCPCRAHDLSMPLHPVGDASPVIPSGLFSPHPLFQLAHRHRGHRQGQHAQPFGRVHGHGVEDQHQRREAQHR